MSSKDPGKETKENNEENTQKELQAIFKDLGFEVSDLKSLNKTILQRNERMIRKHIQDEQEEFDLSNVESVQTELEWAKEYVKKSNMELLKTGIYLTDDPVNLQVQVYREKVSGKDKEMAAALIPAIKKSLHERIQKFEEILRKLNESPSRGGPSL